MQQPRMMPELVVEPLPSHQVRLAYPLLLQALPALTLDEWLSFARKVARTGRHVPAGILVARRTGTPHLCGAVCFRRDPDPQAGAVLTAEHLVALDLLFPQAVMTAMLRALDAVAVELSCQAIRVVVPAPRPGDVGLAGGEYQPAGIVLDRRTRP